MPIRSRVLVSTGLHIDNPDMDLWVDAHGFLCHMGSGRKLTPAEEARALASSKGFYRHVDSPRTGHQAASAQAQTGPSRPKWVSGPGVEAAAAAAAAAQFPEQPPFSGEASGGPTDGGAPAGEEELFAGGEPPSEAVTERLKPYTNKPLRAVIEARTGQAVDERVPRRVLLQYFTENAATEAELAALEAEVKSASQRG